MGNEKGRIRKRILIIMIIISLTCSNFILASSYIIDGLISYAINDETIEKPEVQEEIIPYKIAIDEIYKTNMETQETEYVEELMLNINYIEGANQTAVLDKEVGIYEGEELTEQETGATYKTTKFEKAELEKVLGENDSIVITNLDAIEDAEPLAVVNLETEAEENGDIIIIYPENIERIGMCVVHSEEEKNIEKSKTTQSNETSTVQNETTENTIANVIGNNIVQSNVQENTSVEKEILKPVKINLVNTKSISAVVDKTALNMLQTKKQYAVASEEEILLNEEILVQTKIREKYTKAELGIDKTDLSTTQGNDITYTITLHTENSKRYDLFKNPVFMVELPSWVNSMEIKEIAVLNNQELVVKEMCESTSVNGNKAILVSLEGEQTEYTVSELENIQIALSATIYTTNLMPSAEAETVLYYTNENATGYEDETSTIGSSSTKTTFVASNEVITASFARTDISSVMSFKSDYKTLVVGTQENQTAQILGTIINNTGSDLPNAKVLGTSDILGEITTIQGAEIYYSENKAATLDLADQDNLWSSTYNTNCKKYLICLDNFVQGQIITFASNRVLATESAEYKAIYSVYNDANEVVGLSEVNVEQQEILLDTEVTTSAGTGTVYTGQSLTYTIKVTNTGEVEANGITIQATLPSDVTLVDGETSWAGFTLQPGETLTKQIKVNINDTINANSLNMQVSVNANYLENITTEEATNAVKEADVKVQITTNIRDDIGNFIEKLSVGVEKNYNVRLENISEDNIQNISIQINIPECEQISNYRVYAYTENGREEITDYNVDLQNAAIIVSNLSIDAGKVKEMTLKLKVISYTEKNVKTNIHVSYGEANLLFEEDDVAVVPANIAATLTSNKLGQELTAGDEITYTLSMQNTGETDADIVAAFPTLDALNIKNVSISGTTGNSSTVSSSNISNMNIKVSAGETVTVVITGEATVISEDATVINYVTIKGNDISTITTNNLTNTVLKTVVEEQNINFGNNENNTNNNQEQSDTENNNNQNNNQEQVEPENTYSISGLAWLDKNEDGKRDSDEPILNGIKVELINIATGKTVETLITDSKGEYKFTNLVKGNYLLMFNYNSKYTIKNGNYQKLGVSDNVNSDVLLITENAQTKAITNAIAINNTNIEHIDIGLVLNKVFDLSLEKTITKVTVKNSAGTTINSYDKAELAKVEIPAKVFTGSTVIIEYEIAVINNGEVEGTVSKIVDEIPAGLKFNSELNTSWYEDNGKLYSVELGGETIKPGEKQTIALTLSKTILDENVATIVNNAKIAESFNEYLIEDTKQNEEADATLIISIKTGETAQYIILVLACLIIISAGICLIQKKVVIKK